MKMIISLFENFDPIISILNINLSRIIIIMFIPLLNFYTFIKISRYNTLVKKINNYIFSELRASFNNSNLKIKTFILLRIFFIILTLNTCGLIPYVYTISRQIIFTLTLALPFWIRTITYNIIHNTNNFLRHLVPLSTPLALSQFIVLIESIRQIIRPITLSVRLCANITAGHILLTLTSISISIINHFSIILFLLLLLEIAVALIQRYVFTILISMYLSETT
jgi:F-type H+-transporting ATPase subunit a